MGEGNVERHKVGVTSYRFTSLFSFHVNRPFHSWDTAFSKFDLENPRSRSNDHDVAQLQVAQNLDFLPPTRPFFVKSPSTPNPLGPRPHPTPTHPVLSHSNQSQPMVVRIHHAKFVDIRQKRSHDNCWNLTPEYITWSGYIIMSISRYFNQDFKYMVGNPICLLSF